MRKLFYFIFAFFLVSDYTVLNAVSDISLLEESVRNLTGKIEELEKTVSEMQKDINLLKESFVKKIDEETAKRESEMIDGKNPEDIIKTACGLIDDNNYEEARKLLNLFIKKNPENIYCGMFVFYIGESYFKEKDYKNAAIEYMKSYKKNSKGHKSAEALYKLSLCFKRLSKNEECKATLDKLIRDYPNSGDILTKAKKERSSLK